MAKTYACSVCGTPFSRGRGRPPKNPLCPDHDLNVIKEVPVIEALALEKPVPAIHGATSAAVTTPCPVCLYAYADGGYCPECEWSLPVNRLPRGTATGRTFNERA